MSLTLGNRRRYVILHAGGIEFSYYGDDVLWAWPWKRYGSRQPYISWGSDATFPSLKAIRQFWDEYDQYNRDHPLKGEPNL